jgi:hypothetical protein
MTAGLAVGGWSGMMMNLDDENFEIENDGILW